VQAAQEDAAEMTRHTRLAELARLRAETVADYPERWRTMIEAWRAPRENDAVWLMYAANYLFNTRGVRWAVGSMTLRRRVPEAPDVDAQSDLGLLEVVLLTHGHQDHVDVELWQQLRKSGCHFVVPEHMVEFFTGKAGMADAQCIVASPTMEIAIGGLRIVPFDSPHWERKQSGELKGVPSTGYLVETADGSYLFPGDIRTYDPACLKPFSGVSAVFAHVFLGRSQALRPNPPLLSAFGGPALPRITHAGLHNAFEGKYSMILYHDGGRWMQLQGMD